MKKKNLNLFIFLIFVTTNSLLSYFNLSLESKLWTGLLGLLVPSAFWFLFHEEKKEGEKPMDQSEFFTFIPLWLWFLVAALALAGRFAFLTRLFVWPNFDESAYGFEALQLADQGGPRFFYGVSQAPPFFIWGLALFFKFFGVSMGTLRIFPALLSLSVVPLAYLSARAFFSKSFSFLCAALAAASFWPVFVGRFALMTILILPAQCLCLFLWGRLWKAPDFDAQKKASVFLGLGLGLGFYTHLHWPVVVILIGLPFIFWTLSLFRKNSGNAWALVLRTTTAGALVLLPLVLAAWREHYGGYLYHLWAFKKSFSLSTQLPIWLSYLTSPFWGMDPNVHTYEPQWGGFLNPILASLFFLGVLQMLKNWRRPLYLWLLGGFLFCLLPGLLTQDQETFRLFPMVPILIVGALIGWTGLLTPLQPRRNFLLLLLFLPSLALDSNHLFGAYHRVWDQPNDWGFYTKSVGRYRASHFLEDWHQRLGPGLLFLDFVQGLPDQSLTVATYGYNAVLNPRLDPAQARWAAVLANVNYLPFLKNRFPGASAYPLSKDMPSADGGWMLFVFPLDGSEAGVLTKWRDAQRALEPYIDESLCYVMGQSFQKDIAVLTGLEPAFRGDPFLRSAYYEKKADLETKEDLMKRRDGPISPFQDPAIRSLEAGVREGYPTAHLYEHLAILYWMDQNPEEAKKYFQKAIKAPLNLTDAKRYLSNLAPLKKSEGKTLP